MVFILSPIPGEAVGVWHGIQPFSKLIVNHSHRCGAANAEDAPRPDCRVSIRSPHYVRYHNSWANRLLAATDRKTESMR
jgi:hypothetical protein